MVSKSTEETKAAKKVKSDPYLRFRDMGEREVREALLNCAYTICIWFQKSPTTQDHWDEIIYLTPYARKIAGMAGMVLLHVCEKKFKHEETNKVVSLYPKYPSFPETKTPIEVGIIDAELMMKEMLQIYAFNKDAIVVDDSSVKEYDTFIEMMKFIIVFCKSVCVGGDEDLMNIEVSDYE